MSSKNKIEIRLQKYIADCGVTSRRKAEDLIVQGRVKVNGELVTQLGTKVDPDSDIVDVDGQLLDLKSATKIYIVMNKPRGCVTTLSDPEGRPTVMDYCKEITERIYPVGRLDYLSEGLLVLTNDGEAANNIMHPSHMVVKVYEVKVFGRVSEGLLRKLKGGVKVEDQFLKPHGVRIIKQLPGKTWLEFRLNEGKNREIRKVCEAVGITIDKLKRVAIGGLSIQGISPGSFISVSKKELFREVGLDENGILTKNKVYQSPKKTVVHKKRGNEKVTSADDQAFHKFRKDTYFETVKTLKKNKELLQRKPPKKREEEPK